VDAVAEAHAELAAAQEALANAVKATDKTKAKRAIKAAEKKLSKAGTVEDAPAAANAVPVPTQSTATAAPARVEVDAVAEAHAELAAAQEALANAVKATDKTKAKRAIKAAEKKLSKAGTVEDAPAASNGVPVPTQSATTAAPARVEPVPAGEASLTPVVEPNRERQNKKAEKEKTQSKTPNKKEEKQRKNAGAKEEKQNKKKAEKAEKQQAKQADRELKREARKAQQEERRNQKMLKQEEEQAAADAVAAKASKEIEAARAAGQAAAAGPAFLVRAGNPRELTGPQSGGTLSVEILTCSNLLAADRGKTCVVFALSPCRICRVLSTDLVASLPSVAHLCTLVTEVWPTLQVRPVCKTAAGLDADRSAELGWPHRTDSPLDEGCPSSVQHTA
jgi:hypothetical protein